MKTFVLASKNKHKAMEIKKILGNEYDIKTMDEMGLNDFEIIEDGNTFKENAAKKAIAVFEKLNIPIIADDSGLCVDYLNGMPGVHTARFAGENATNEDNINKLLNELKDVPFEKRKAKFVCVIAMVENSPKDVKVFRGECEGYITESQKGKSGFGYDPVFYYEKFDMTLAEMGEELKNSISHRYKALERFSNYLEN